MPTVEHALMSFAPKPDAVMVRGQGSWLWDQRGQRYLDFVQGWAVNALGHCPELVQRALAEQAGQLINSSPAYYNEPSLQYAEALTQRAGLEKVFFCSSGAEANEGAIKLARKWGGLHRGGAYEIITAADSFHGRTLATMAASGKPGFAQIFPPAMPGFVHVPYGDVAAMAQAINERTAAVLVEPIQGEAGVVVPPSGYLHALRKLTQERGVLLIADEIQTGMARTGKMFGCEHENVVPDIMTLGKGVGAGIPLAALLARAAVSCFAPGDQGGTYSAHPLQSAVGLAVLRAMEAPGFLEHVVEAGDYLASGLRDLANRRGLGEVRGRGLLWALNLGGPLSAAVVQAAFTGGLLINGPRPELLRFMPALTVTLAEIDELIARLQPAIAEAQAMPPS